MDRSLIYHLQPIIELQDRHPMVLEAWLTQKQTMGGRIPGDLVSVCVCACVPSDF